MPTREQEISNGAAVLPSIDPQRLHRLLDELSRFGRTPRGGLNRVAASAEDGAARDFLCEWLRREGCRVAIDRVGNIYGTLDLAGDGAPLVLTGSHLDSQPAGGRFDGAFGVAAGCEALVSIREFATRHGLALSRNLGVTSWTNEEGARFAPSCLGSGVYADLHTVEFALSRTDGKGATLEEALRAIGYLGTDSPPGPPVAYLEAHIEQGPILEREGCVVGVVEGNWGTAKYIADIEGEASHTGPTPMVERRDALLAAAAIILNCRKIADEAGGEVLSSVGRLDITPNSTNVVAGRVRLFAEFRALRQDMLEVACTRFERESAAAAQSAKASVRLERVTDRRAGVFDPGICELIEEMAAGCGYPLMRMHTIAGHDAISLRAVCPTAMIFVPSAGGISHNESEFTEPQHLEAGATVLTQALYRLVA